MLQDVTGKKISITIFAVWAHLDERIPIWIDRNIHQLQKKDA